MWPDGPGDLSPILGLRVRASGGREGGTRASAIAEVSLVCSEAGGRLLGWLEQGPCFAGGFVPFLADGLPGWLDRGLEKWVDRCGLGGLWPGLVWSGSGLRLV